MKIGRTSTNLMSLREQAVSNADAIECPQRKTSGGYGETVRTCPEMRSETLVGPACMGCHETFRL